MKFLASLYFVFWGFVFFSPSVAAYIDPASSSYLLQIIAGIFIAGGTAIGVYWRKIKLFFTKGNKKKNK